MLNEAAEGLMIGCLVHYCRLYQHVAERVSASEPRDLHRISKDTFCTIELAGACLEGVLRSLETSQVM